MTSTAHHQRWYAEVTRYQWLVLIIASAGWVFDVFEGQLFNITREQMLQELLGARANDAEIKRWGDLLIAVFLVGGTIGGVVFGMLGDRIGRKPTMAITILFYSLFAGLTYFATELWHVAGLRFFVALGIGGEWSVAAALVAEVFPARARARASAIFHGTSVGGVWLAAIAGMLVGANWRYAYLIGILPALLVLWVRTGIHEPPRDPSPENQRAQRGSLRELFGDPRWAKSAVFGVLLAAVGLGTFWSVNVAGQDLAKAILQNSGFARAEAAERAKFAFGIVQAIGGGLGLFCFGPLAEWLGRRGAFSAMFLCAFCIVPVTCFLPTTYTQLLCLLPVFGFFTGGFHAGYAVYFPELFPERLRATGAGVCFNGGRLLAAPLLFFSGTLKAWPGVSLPLAVTLLSLLFLFGIVVLAFMPETKGRPLPK